MLETIERSIGGRLHPRPATPQDRAAALAAPALAVKACGHARHVGTCACCQRALIAVHQAQLAAALAAGAAWRADHPR